MCSLLFCFFSFTCFHFALSSGTDDWSAFTNMISVRINNVFLILICSFHETRCECFDYATQNEVTHPMCFSPVNRFLTKKKDIGLKVTDNWTSIKCEVIEKQM